MNNLAVLLIISIFWASLMSPLLAEEVKEIKGIRKFINNIGNNAKHLFGSLIKHKEKEKDTTAETKSINNDELNTFLSQAQSYISQGEYNQSITILTELIKTHNNNTQANFLLGTALLAINQTDYASEFLYNAVELSQWSDILSIYNLAECFRLINECETALKITLKGLENCENRIDQTGLLTYMLGNIYLTQKSNYTLAAEYFLLSAQYRYTYYTNTYNINYTSTYYTYNNMYNI